MLGDTQLGLGDQAAEMPVSRLGLGEHGETRNGATDGIPWVETFRGDAQFGADVSPQAEFFHKQVETRGAVDSIGIQQRHGGHVQLGAKLRHFLGDAGGLQEAESGTGMEFYVVHDFCRV